MRNILLFVILISCTALCFAKNLEFKTLGLVGDEPLQSMVELPDGSILIAAEHGLFKSTDKGQTWDLLEFAQKDTSIYKLKLLKNGSVLASTDSGLFRSDDFGLTWKEIVFNSKNINNYFHNYKKNILYSILDSSIYLSSDNGDNWNLFLKKESLPNKTWDFIETDNGDFFCVSYGLDYKYHLMVSKDKGLTWNEIYYEKNEYDDEISGFIYLNGDTIFGKSDHGYLYSSIYLINLEKDSVNIFYKDIYYFIYDITKDTAGNFYYATRLGLYKHDIINNSVELIFQKTYLNDCLENVSIIKDVLII
ncbi:MAG: hypothetical protein HZB41_09520 [Ignavibacteriae bacterium]|nr:hypothetical protein [Ignavibacteriota bacterium]